MGFTVERRWEGNMPVIRNIQLNLETDNLMRREGIREPARVKAEMKRLIGEMQATVDSDHLLEPAMAYEIHPVKEVRDKRLYLEGDVVLNGAKLVSVLGEAKELAVIISTIGPKLEERATEYFRQGEPLRGFLLDGIGSAAIDALYQEICILMMRQSSIRGYQAGSRLSPGSHGFPISEQSTLFELAPGGEIGVSLNESGMMLPQKSTSMVMGLGPKMATWTQAESCARCQINKTCLHKVTA